MDIIKHLEKVKSWSVETFGPGPRPDGIVDHIRKELIEILEDPNDLEEWIDVITLAFDGALREGYSPAEIISCLVNKHEINAARSWPDWRLAEPGKAIEHIK